MKRYYTLWVSLVAALILGGCGARPFVQTDAATIILKTPKLRFADTGYIRSNDKLVALELFSAGQAVGKFEIANLVCVEGEGCMRKSSFNAEYLSAEYPDSLMENVLRAKPIYGGEALVRDLHGFEQNISKVGVDIRYKVTDRQIYFKDRANSILIKIKKEEMNE